MRRSYKFLCRFSGSNICIPNNPRKSATWFTTSSCFYDSTAFDVIKVPMKRTFLLSYSKELSKWWLLYCDSTLGCRVIRDVVLCKLDHFVTLQRGHKVKSQKSEYLSGLFLYRTETTSCICIKLKVQLLHSSQSSMSTVTFPWQDNGLQALPHSKGKTRVFLLQEVLLILHLLFTQWVWANMDIT